ncbi:MAG: HlyD family secretion protein [Planctomycetota bacterium]
MMILAATVGLGLSLVAAQEGATPDQPEAVEASEGDLRKTIDVDGTLVPPDAAEISLWLEEYRGELLVLEVAEHGSFVNEGDVLIRFDTTPIDDQIRQAEFDLDQARRKLANTERENGIQEEAAGDDLARAEKGAEWAARNLAAYLEKERAFRLEEIRLRKQSWRHSLEDQRDELEQLEKMYREDELVDATEEIVLKRSRRRLASSVANTTLREQQSDHSLAHTEAIKQEGLEQAAALKAAALDRQRRSTAIKRATREAGLERSRFDLDNKQANLEGLKRDREQLVVASLHKTIMVVADPDRLKVVTEVPEASLFEARSGTAAELTLVAVPDFKTMGPLKVAYLPTGRAGNDGNVYRAEIEIDAQEPRLRPGMVCKVSIVIDDARGAARGPQKKAGGGS